MSTDVQERIRARAHAIWIEEGCPEGRDHDHWLRAEQEILGTADAPARKAPARKTAAKSAAPKTKPAASKAATDAPKTSRKVAKADAAEPKAETARKPRARKTVPA